MTMQEIDFDPSRPLFEQIDEFAPPLLETSAPELKDMLNAVDTSTDAETLDLITKKYESSKDPMYQVIAKYAKDRRRMLIAQLTAEPARPRLPASTENLLAVENSL